MILAGYWYETASVIGLIAGPVLAVLITLWHQERTQKRQAKLQLFLTLMAHRKSVAPPLDRTNALNLIDVVYAGDSKVVALWHRLYELLCQKPEGVDVEAKNHTNLDLLSEMAKVLGYKNLQQTDIDKFYVPQDVGDNAQMQVNLAKELLRVLKSTQSFSATPKELEPLPVK